MEQVLSFIQGQDWLQWVGVATTVLTAAIAVASLFPGDEPERTLQKVLDFLAKFSRK